MTKKHFEAIAHTLNANRADLSLVQDMADTLEEFSSTFSRRLFIEASTRNLVDFWTSQKFLLDSELPKR